MPMFAIGVVPLIRHLYSTARQVWYADDSAAAGSLLELRRWWDRLNHIGPKFPWKKNKKKNNYVHGHKLRTIMSKALATLLS